MTLLNYFFWLLEGLIVGLASLVSDPFIAIVAIVVLGIIYVVLKITHRTHETKHTHRFILLLIVIFPIVIWTLNNYWTRTLSVIDSQGNTVLTLKYPLKWKLDYTDFGGNGYQKFNLTKSPYPFATSHDQLLTIKYFDYNVKTNNHRQFSNSKNPQEYAQAYPDNPYTTIDINKSTFYVFGGKKGGDSVVFDCFKFTDDFDCVNKKYVKFFPEKRIEISVSSSENHSIKKDADFAFNSIKIGDKYK